MNDIIIDRGIISDMPSTIVRIENNKINIFSRDLICLDEYEILIKEKKYTINRGC